MNKKTLFIRPLLFFLVGFFLGNGGIIKGEFTQSLYEVFDFMTKQILPNVGQIFSPLLSMVSKANLTEFKKSLLEGNFSSTMDPVFIKLPKETLFQELFQKVAGGGYPSLNVMLGPPHWQPDAFGQNLEKFYFLNLFFLFCLIESLNFIFFGKQYKKNKLTERKNSSYFFLPKQSFQKTQDKRFEQGAFGQKTVNLKSDNYEFRSRKFGLWPEASVQKLFFQKKFILLNPMKLGFLFGLFVDAFKVGS